ncbi:hypothetical protein, partial [Acetobacter cerevisiae]|uniref:hypothetical protein n=1 Tax=Acetobacter cerevisiae TaxID=178900 RepID=UPI002232A87B
ERRQSRSLWGQTFGEVSTGFCSEVLKVALLIQTRDYHSSDYLGQRLAEDFRLRASLKGLSPVGN